MLNIFSFSCDFCFLCFGIWDILMPKNKFFCFFFFLFSGKDSWNQRERKKHLTLLFVCCGLVAQLCLTVCNPLDCILSGSSAHGDSSDKNTEVGCHTFLLQGIFPTQGLKPGLWHCRQIGYHLSHQRSPLDFAISI